MAYNVNSLTDDCYPNTLCLILITTKLSISFYLKICILGLVNCEVLTSQKKELHFAVHIILKKCVERVLTISNQDIYLLI